jgi:hypothetical protein
METNSPPPLTEEGKDRHAINRLARLAAEMERDPEYGRVFARWARGVLGDMEAYLDKKEGRAE